MARIVSFDSVSVRGGHRIWCDYSMGIGMRELYGDSDPQSPLVRFRVFRRVESYIGQPQVDEIIYDRVHPSFGHQIGLKNMDSFFQSRRKLKG
jgi:hypothetical protein